MIAERIELIDVETALVGTLQAFVELEVKNLEPQPLRLLDLFGFAGDLNFEVCHAEKKITYEPRFGNGSASEKICHESSRAKPVPSQTKGREVQNSYALPLRLCAFARDLPNLGQALAVRPIGRALFEKCLDPFYDVLGLEQFGTIDFFRAFERVVEAAER